MKPLQISKIQGEVLRELADGELHECSRLTHNRRSTMACLQRRGWVSRHVAIDGRIASLRECALRPRAWRAAYVITRDGREALRVLIGGER
jgi:uncharacterized protein YjhX (UPF0386 family)